MPNNILYKPQSVDYGTLPQDMNDMMDRVHQTAANFNNRVDELFPGIKIKQEQERIRQEEKNKKDNLSWYAKLGYAAMTSPMTPGDVPSVSPYASERWMVGDKEGAQSMQKTQDAIGSVAAGLSLLGPYGVADFAQTAGTYGLGTALAAEGLSWGTGTVGYYGGNWLGQKIDNKHGTNITPWLSILTSIGGGVAGYKKALKHAPTILKTFAKDAVKPTIDYNQLANTVGYINTVDDALLEGSPLTTNKSSQFWDGTSKSNLTWEERLGIPKGERNQPGKPRSPRAVEYDIVDGRPTKEFLDDYRAYVEALKTGGRRVDITDMFDSSWYRQRLLNQGLTEEQANQLILRLKDRVSPENLVVVDGLNSVRNFRRIEDGIPIEMTPERLSEFGRHTTGPGLSGKSLISLTTKADPEEIILHEIGGHRSQPLVADFNGTYLDQSLTDLGLQRHMKIGKTADYGLNWGEVRARALTIAKQMSDAGWNPNSPEQVNVWLNKHILTNNPTNVNQGALYYNRPKFIKAVSEGFKNGGKIK